MSYDGTNWNIVGDLDTNVDTTYDIMSVDEAKTGTSIVPRVVNAANFKQTITDISRAKARGVRHCGVCAPMAAKKGYIPPNTCNGICGK